MGTFITYDPNADLEERAQLYVGVSKYTGLFTFGVLDWLRWNESRFNHFEFDYQVVAELHAFDKERCPWTDNLQRADCWDSYWIDRFQRYLSEVTWRKVGLRVAPL